MWWELAGVGLAVAGACAYLIVRTARSVLPGPRCGGCPGCSEARRPRTRSDGGW
jgi:hypothetical protein